MARLAKKGAAKPKAALGGSKNSMGKKTQLSSAKTSAAATVNSLLSKELNEFLHQEKDTKKQRRDEKKANFLSKIGAESTSSTLSLGPDSYKHTTVTEANPQRSKAITTIHDLPGKISKSSLRRRKRKAKSAVLTSVTDLGNALPDFSTEATNSVTASTDKQAYKSSTKNVATDRPPTSRMTERVVRHEMTKFNETLKSAEFKASPFAALRASINASMVKKAEFVSKPDSMEM